MVKEQLITKLEMISVNEYPKVKCSRKLFLYESHFSWNFKWTVYCLTWAGWRTDLNISMIRDLTLDPLLYISDPRIPKHMETFRWMSEGKRKHWWAEMLLLWLGPTKVIWDEFRWSKHITSGRWKTGRRWLAGMLNLKEGTWDGHLSEFQGRLFTSQAHEQGWGFAKAQRWELGLSKCSQGFRVLHAGSGEPSSCFDNQASLPWPWQKGNIGFAKGKRLGDGHWEFLPQK